VGNWNFGSSLRRVMESGAGADSMANASERTWQTGLGWEPTGARIFWRPTFHYEFLSHGFSPFAVDHIVSLGSNLMSNDALRLEASVRIPQNQADLWGMGAGLTARFRLRRALLECRYALAYRAPDDPVADVSQAVSLQMRWQAFKDRVPPMVQLSVDTSLWTPNAKPLSFRLAVDDNRGQPKSWKLSLHRARKDGSPGSLAREFAGDGLPPRLIQWNADDAQGLPMPSGIYLARLWAEDVDGNSAVTPWHMLELKSAAAAPADTSADFLPE
jgi:hypothetical protein